MVLKLGGDPKAGCSKARHLGQTEGTPQWAGTPQLAADWYKLVSPSAIVLEISFRQASTMTETDSKSTDQSGDQRAEALLRAEQFEEAIQVLRRNLANRVSPNTEASHATRLLLSQAHSQSGDLDAASLALQPTVDAGHMHAASWDGLGRIYIQLDKLDAAEAHYGRWLELQPEHPIPTHMRVALSGQDAPPRAAATYISEYFDIQAKGFHWTHRNSEYAGPDLVAKLLHTASESSAPDKPADVEDKAPTQRLRVLDLGCGAGLLGPALRSVAGELHGIDLSSGMLELARATGLYDKLEHQDLQDWLPRVPDDLKPYDLIVAVDTLCYFGELSNVLNLCTRALAPNGQLILSLEQVALSDDCHPLMPNGRYGHSPHYIVWQMGELGIVGGTMHKVVLRKDAGRDVNAMMLSVARPKEFQS